MVGTGAQWQGQHGNVVALGGGASGSRVPAPRASAARVPIHRVPAGRTAPGHGSGTSDDPVAALGAGGLQDVASPRGCHAGALGWALGAGPLVWVQDAVSRLEFGAPHARALAAGGLDPSRLTLVRVSRARDALWAMEEALRAGLAVVGEIEGAPRALDFTATRRLEARARGAGTTCVLVRMGARVDLAGSSGARCRWRVSPHPSAPDAHDARAPGAPRWLLELTRARHGPPGRWIVEAPRDEDGPHRLRVVAALADGDVAAGGTPSVPREGGAVVPLRPGRAA